MRASEFLNWIDRAPFGKRVAATRALCRFYVEAEMESGVQDAVEAALTLLLDDPAAEVRQALAEVLGPSPAAPHHIIISLAVDLPEIAAIVLAQSPLLSDAELVDIAAAGTPLLQAAIAERQTVSSAVAAALAEVGERNALLTLLGNPGAAIARISFRRIAERFADDTDMRDLMLMRIDLPADVHQMIIRHLGDTLGTMMVAKSWAEEDRAITVTRDACDRATVALAAETESEELPALVEHLRVTGQLTTGLLLRAVCAGNAAVFETALAVLARVPAERVASLVRAGRLSALKAIYGKAGLPPRAFRAFAVALDAGRQIAEEGGSEDRYHFTRRIVDAVLSEYNDISDGEMYELATMLRRFAADQARVAAREIARRPEAA